MGAGDGLVVHDDVQGPLEALVVDDRPLGGEGLSVEVALDTGGPVGAANAHIGHHFFLHVFGVDGLAAIFGDLGGDHHVAPVQTGAKAVHHRVEQATGALFKDGHRPYNTVGIVHFVGEPLEVILQNTGVAPSREQAHDTGFAAGAMFNVQLVEVDEFHLGTRLLGGHQGLLAHGVVAAVGSAAGQT